MIEDLGSIGRQMQIDRALDSQVARLVFGHKVSLVESGWGVGLYLDNNELLPDYSGDIRLAWKVLEKIQELPENSLTTDWNVFEFVADARVPIVRLKADDAAKRICEEAVALMKGKKP